MKAVCGSSEFHEWSRSALSLLAQQIPPDEIVWADESPQPLLPGLTEGLRDVVPSKVQAAIVPAAFAAAARKSKADGKRQFIPRRSVISGESRGVWRFQAS